MLMGLVPVCKWGSLTIAATLDLTPSTSLLHLPAGLFILHPSQRTPSTGLLCAGLRPRICQIWI